MFRRLECSLSVVIIEMDRNFNVCYVSPGIRYFTGETPRLLIGKNFCNMIHKEDVKRVRPKFRALLQQGSRVNSKTSAAVWPTEAGPIRYRRKKSGGGYMWVEAVGHSIGVMTGINTIKKGGSTKTGQQQHTQETVTSTRNSLVFSERDIGRWVDVLFCLSFYSSSDILLLF
jgi:PAS domain S-box-containing protein